MNWKRHISLLWFCVFVLCMAACYIIDSLQKEKYKPEYIAPKTQEYFNQQLKDLENDVINNNFFNEKFLDQHLKNVNPSYFLYLFDDDSLIYWNNKTVDPPTLEQYSADYYKDTLLLNNNYYVYSKVVDLGSSKKAIAYIPIATNYPYENDNLNSTLFAFPKIKNHFNVLQKFDVDEGSFLIKDKNNIPAFALNFDTDFEIIRKPTVLLITLFILGIAAFFICIMRAIELKYPGLNKKKWVFIIALIFFVGLAKQYIFPTLPFNLENNRLFSSTLMASQNFVNSLSELFIYSVLSCWLFVNIAEYYKRKKTSRYSVFINQLIAICVGFAGIFFIYRYTFTSVTALVIDSKIPFNIDDFFSLNQYTLLAFFILLIISFVAILIIQIICCFLRNAFSNIYVRHIILLLIAILFSIATNKPGFELGLWMLPILIVLTSLLFNFFDFNFYQVVYDSNYSYNNNTYIWIVVIGAILSASLTYFNYVKEKEIRKAFVQNLFGKSDIDAELTLHDIATPISEDTVLQKLMLSNDNIKLNNNSAEEYLLSHYINTTFESYKKKVYFFTNKDSLIGNEGDLLIKEINASQKQISKVVPLNNFLFPSNSYWIKIPILYKNDTIGLTGLLLVKSIKKGANNSNMLFNTESSDYSNITDEYRIANYYDNDLLHANSNSFPNHWTYGITKDEFVFREHLLYSDLIYKISDKEYVVVKYSRNLFYQYIAIFSYFSIILLVIYFLYVLFKYYVIYPTSKRNSLIKNINSYPLSTRINYAFLSLAFICLVVVGAVTISFLVTRYSRDQNNYLHNRIESALSVMFGVDAIDKKEVIGYKLDKNTTAINRLNLYAEIEDLCVNIYDADGILTTSTKSDLKNSGMISRVMNPIVLQQLNKNINDYYTINESFGKLNYKSIYKSIRDVKGNISGFVNIPYYASRASVKSEISNVIVALMNVYVFVFFISAFFAFLLSKNVTRSFQLLISQFNNLSFRHNESISWPHDDEIGMLIKEYNKMTKRVEHMAVLLANTEREMAWRDIAKQVAHEIKNPLTPMKLQVQYLEQSVKEQRENVPELTKKITTSLLQQIEHLNLIASEFSDFAKLPAAHYEIISLQESLQTIVDLYQNEESIQIDFISDNNIFIRADKNYLNRIFNNIFQNAKQSILPDHSGLIEISLTEDDNSIMVIIKDNGRGISAENLKKIFIPNFTTKSSGTGIGLSMTKSMMETMGGNIWFESEVYVGTTVFLQFPHSNIN